MRVGRILVLTPYMHVKNLLMIVKPHIFKQSGLLLSISSFILVVCMVLIAAISSDADELKTGESLYRKNCFACHPNAKKITGHKSILKTMRNPPPYMPVFSEDRLSDDDAGKIEDYVLRILK